jgi:murein L,D-transpeptidase YafK
MLTTGKLALAGLLAVAGWLSAGTMAATANGADVWLLVDTRADTLAIMQGRQAVKKFPHIALGRGGTGTERQRGDSKTPLGEFQVGWINWNSSFHIFIGLDFPNREHAQRAYRRKLIDNRTYQAIQDALLRGQTPPQDTPLGGQIGIHGLGKADPVVHRAFNWTRGCIALTNEEIEEVAGWVRPGTKVIIR